MLIKEFEDFKSGYYPFIRGAHIILKDALGNFFSAEVNFLCPSISLINQVYKIYIKKEPKREVYIVKNDTILIVSHFIDIEHDTMYLLGVTFKSPYITSYNSKIFNVTAKTLSSLLKSNYRSNFSNSFIYSGENFIKQIIAWYVGKGHFNIPKLLYLMEKFNALRTTTFEGKYFSTGIIITKSLHDYKGDSNNDTNRNGIVFRLDKGCNITDTINSRFWYLADGVKSYYITDGNKDISNLFIYTGQNQDYVSESLLKDTLYGGDVLIRTLNGRELSIINSSLQEFVYQENSWKYRDYKILEHIIMANTSIDEDVCHHLMYFILYSSRSDISSIIWLPKNIEEAEKLLLYKNKGTRSCFNITDENDQGIIKRFLSSDGSVMIDGKGNVLYFGCIVNLSNIKIRNTKGTGETAAQKLSSNGLSIKISQDGAIKIFINGNEPIKI